jgi:hypothetical protein
MYKNFYIERVWRGKRNSGAGECWQVGLEQVDGDPRTSAIRRVLFPKACAF